MTLAMITIIIFFQGFMMIFEKLEIPGIYLLKPERFTDERGFFSETYNKKKFDSLLGKNVDFVQVFFLFLNFS